MNRTLTSEQRIEAVFRGEMVDRVPFALKGWRAPFCGQEPLLRNDGMGIFEDCPVFTSTSPHVTTETISCVEDGTPCTRTIVRTPVGEITSVSRTMGDDRIDRTSWIVEHFFKSPEDYKVLMFIAGDARHEPAYENYGRRRAQMDGDAYLKTGAPGAALHEIMIMFMGVETFSFEWAERRDEIIALDDAMTRSRRDAYRIIAASPALVVCAGGNYAPEVLGMERFREFVLPHWEEAAGILHEGGKLLGSHLDANNRLWADEIGTSPLDWIEAFTPAPDTDMTMAEARAAWAGKTLFINFPSSVHLSSAEEIEDATRKLLEEAAPGDRFIIGITENVPEHCWRESFATILRTCNEYGRLPIHSSRI